MENATAKIILRDDFIRKDGTQPIYLRVTVKRITIINKFRAKEHQEVPLNQNALSLLPDKTFIEDRVFRVYTNQPQNRFLKEAVKLAGINKTISFHCSRHTFATLLLGSGQPIETVCKLLGHQDIKTTQIYAKVLPHSKIAAVNALHNLMEE